uniref:Ig-like domain-containing protein n=1 Tax=Anopheles culicifacies TaxID=139723 RepID=A0A182MUU6_9DIPT
MCTQKVSFSNKTLHWEEHDKISVGLRNVRVTVPTAVRKGDSAHLFCDYELEDKERLYSIKWYKGKREFYRYTPQEKPSMKVFTAVDVESINNCDNVQNGWTISEQGKLHDQHAGRSLSNESNVVIKALETNVSGKYSCEVSADAPSFHTMIVSGDMEVIEPPPEKPSITGLQGRYRPGDILRGNCTSINSKPPANLTWTINDVPIIPQYYKQYRPIKDTHTGLETSILGINILVAHGHFVKGKLKLKCQATIHQIYDESSEWYVEEDRPRILATGSSSSHNLNQIYQQSVYDGELTDQSDMYLTVNGYKADKSPTSSSSATKQVGAYVKVGWIAFYICTICTVLLYSLRIGIS